MPPVWLIIKRLSPFLGGERGEHELKLTVGGSPGHHSEWAYDAEVGCRANPYWKVTLTPYNEKVAQNKVDSLSQRFLAAVAEFPEGECKTNILSIAKLKPGAGVNALIDSLVTSGKVEQIVVKKLGKEYINYRPPKVKPAVTEGGAV